MKNFLTIINTVWLYPTADITAALATTTYSYTFNGDVITCPDMANLIGVYTDIFNQTTISQPVGNVGFTLGVGTFLIDLGDELRFALEGGAVVIVWRLVKQITPQHNTSYCFSWQFSKWNNRLRHHICLTG